MKLTLTSLALLLVCSITMAQNQSQTLLFDYDDYSLKSKHQNQLQILLDSLEKYDDYSITISGHTDADGSDEYNKTLSQNRTNSVKDYFIEHNIPSDKISTASLGEKKPVANNSSLSGKQQNRRVEVTINYIHKKEVVDIWELYQQTINPPKEYVINNTKDTVLRCDKGTLLYIKANSFIDNGTPIKDEQITLQVKEVYDKSDMILESLTTTSNGALLETGGMVYINAFGKNEKPAEIAPDKSITVFKPTDNIIQNTLLFTGERDPHNDVMDWTPTNSTMTDASAIGLAYCSSEALYKNVTGPRDKGKRKIDNCPFFFCKINRFFGSLAKSKEERDKTSNRKARKNVRTRGYEDIGYEYDCTKRDSILDFYGFDDYQDLIAELKREKLRGIETNYNNSAIRFEDLQYYTFNVNGFGWNNIDAFLKMPARALTEVNVNVKPQTNIDIRLVFKKRNILAYGSSHNNQYRFESMPKGERAYLVALKYDGDSPLVSIEEIKVEKGATYNVNFKKLSLDELKQELKKINS